MSLRFWTALAVAALMLTKADGAVAQSRPLSSFQSPWTGPYIAATASYGRQSHDMNMRLPENASQDAGPAPYPTTSYWLQQDIPGVNAVGQMLSKLNRATLFPSVGYDVQLGTFLVGAEASYNFLAQEAGTSTAALYNSGGSFSIDQHGSVEALLRAGPRFGVIFDNMLIYAKGGLARGKLSYNGSLTDSFGHVETASAKAWSNGWYAGGGLEFQISPTTSLRFEVTYTDLKPLQISGGYANQLSVNYFDSSYRFRETAASLGLVLRFN